LRIWAEGLEVELVERKRAEPASFSSGYFPALTGFRAVAAYLVFFHHFNPLGPGNLLYGLFAEGHVGVTFFFVLSGFLIAWRYGSDGPRRKFVLRTYLLNRIARIWPLYFLLTFITLIVYRVADPSVWLANFTFLKGFSDAWKFTGIAQGWSLTVEETFYLSAPVIFLVTPVIARAARRLRLPEWSALLVQPVLWFTFGAGLVLFANKLSERTLFFENVRFVTLYTFFGRSFEFYCGYLAAARFRAFTRRPSDTRGVLTWTSTAAVILLIYCFSLFRGGEYAYGVFHPLGLVLNNVALPPCIAVLIYGLATEGTICARVLSLRPVELLGKSSYAFYLVHVGVFESAIRSVIPRASVWTRFLVLNIVAIAMFKLVEEPLNRAVKAVVTTRGPNVSRSLPSSGLDPGSIGE
jgi:peptidoglycan/LPS O-acetylase OafA/YrhL